MSGGNRSLDSEAVGLRAEGVEKGSRLTDTMPTPVSVPTRLTKLRQSAFAPIDIAWLVVFRIVFGLALLREIGGAIAGGRVTRNFIEPDFYFTYQGFTWLEPLPAAGMYFLHWGLCICAMFIVLGLFYRMSLLLFLIGFGYIFLLDQTHYLNHHYLVLLFCFLMVFLPANRAWSDDVLIWPRIRSSTVPSWTLWLLQAQIGIVYFYAAIAKINVDWLLRGEPIRTWMARRSDLSLVGFLNEEIVIYTIAWGGFLFDLLIIPMLLWRRTRAVAFIASIGFHMSNFYLFNIGIFPWMMLGATTIFFAPDWPRRFGKYLPAHLVGRIRKEKPRPKGKREAERLPNGHGENRAVRRRQTICLGLIGGYLLVQVLLPVRHHLYPGDVAWTEEGHMFSWRMLLRTKHAHATFLVRAFDPQSGEWIEGLPEEFRLTETQGRKMWGRPDRIVAAAHGIADVLGEKGFEEIEVKARVDISLNAGPYSPLIDPEVNLVEVKRNIWPSEWILPRPR